MDLDSLGARALVAAIVEQTVKDCRYLTTDTPGVKKSLSKTYQCFDAPSWLLSPALPYVASMLDLPYDFVARTRALVLQTESP